MIMNNNMKEEKIKAPKAISETTNELFVNLDL